MRTAISATARKPVGAERHHPRIGAHDVRDHAEERARPRPIDCSPAARSHEALALTAHDSRAGQERRERRAHRVGAGTRAAAAVRRAERLVQVEVADVEAGVAGTGDAEDAVGVRLVVRGERADAVRGVDALLDRRVVDAGVLGVGDHDRRRARRERPLQCLEVGVAVGVGVEGDDVVSRRLRCRGVRRVAEDRRDDLATLLALAVRLMEGPDHGDVRPDRRRTALRVQRDLVHAGDLGDHALGAPHDLEHALRVGGVLQRVHGRERGRADELVVDLRRVLHGAGALADVDVEVGAEVLLREPQVVLEDAHLAHLGQGGRRRATKSRRQVGHDVADRIAHAGLDAGDEHAAFAGRREFEDDRLVPARLLEAAKGGLGCDGEAHALCSSRVAVSDASGSDLVGRAGRSPYRDPRSRRRAGRCRAGSSSR